MQFDIVSLRSGLHAIGMSIKWDADDIIDRLLESD